MINFFGGVIVVGMEMVFLQSQGDVSGLIKDGFG